MISRLLVIGAIMKPGISRITCRIGLAFRAFFLPGAIAA
jgi:hypothetical protein